MYPYQIATIGQIGELPAALSFLPKSPEEAKDRLLHSERFGLIVGLLVGAVVGSALARRKKA